MTYGKLASYDDHERVTVRFDGPAGSFDWNYIVMSGVDPTAAVAQCHVQCAQIAAAQMMMAQLRLDGLVP